MLYASLLILISGCIFASQVNSFNANKPYLPQNGYNRIHHGINNLHQFNNILKNLVENNLYHGLNKFIYVPPFSRHQYPFAGPPPPPFPHPMIPRPLPPHLKLLPAYNHSYNQPKMLPHVPMYKIEIKPVSNYNMNETKPEYDNNKSENSRSNESKAISYYDYDSSTKINSQMPNEIPQSYLYKYRPLKEILQKKTRKGKLYSLVYGSPYPVEEIDGRKVHVVPIEYLLKNITLRGLVKDLNSIAGKYRPMDHEYYGSTRRAYFGNKYNVEKKEENTSRDYKKSSDEYKYDFPLAKTEKKKEEKEDVYAPAKKTESDYKENDKKISDEKSKDSEKTEKEDSNDFVDDYYFGNGKKVSYKYKRCKKDKYKKDDAKDNINYYFDTNTPTEIDKEDFYDKLDLFLQKSDEEAMESGDDIDASKKDSNNEDKQSQEKKDGAKEDVKDSYYQADQDYYSE